jgi:polar amino acid transport system substrate-binding protein
MWYAIVTMSTVGYGDKVPVTALGKMTTILWMFFGIISFGVFSGNVSSQIDLASAENNIFAPEVPKP